MVLFIIKEKAATAHIYMPRDLKYNFFFYEQRERYFKITFFILQRVRKGLLTLINNINNYSASNIIARIMCDTFTAFLTRQIFKIYTIFFFNK